jgi:hypothetical protein
MSALAGWILSAEFGRQKLSLLALCIASMYVVSSRLQWQLTQPRRGRRLVLRVGQSQLARGAFQLARLMYYVGIPVAALWRVGHLQELALPTSRVQNWDAGALFGLSGGVAPGSAAGFGAALAVLGASLLLMMTVWVWYAHAALRAPAPGPRRPLPPFAWWLALREALFLQVFWLFCRSVVRLWTGDRIWVAFGSMALTMLMWALSPLRVARLRDPFRAHVEVQHWMLAMWTGAAYVATNLFWPQVLWHALWLWLSGRFLSHLSRVKSQAPLAGVGASQ